jgi:hypothetical protein
MIELSIGGAFGGSSPERKAVRIRRGIRLTFLNPGDVAYSPFNWGNVRIHQENSPKN